MSGIPRTGRRPGAPPGRPGTAGSPAARPARYLNRAGHRRGGGPAVVLADRRAGTPRHPPAVVSGCGQAFITAQQQAGAAATAKHFPGLGSATKNQNTDSGPVTLTVSLTKLHTIDEVPYPAAVGAGVKLVMVSWAIYPALDARRPAGLLPAGAGAARPERVHRRHHHRCPGSRSTERVRHDRPTRGHRGGAGMDLILCSARDVSQAKPPPPRWPAPWAAGNSTRRVQRPEL
jgi:hypothetical protein